VRVDPHAGVAVGEAIIPDGLPILADHFPRIPILPGSFFIELVAQVAGPLCEDVTRLCYGHERGALLGMVRRAVFLRPCVLPATVQLRARVGRCDPTRVSVATTASVEDAVVFRAELVMAMIDVPAEWAHVVEARHERVARWRGAGAA
jgi:3-hydroxymyristoyl/3-hydroxydecanoyl-(acyl carrier protein) dehydratase